MTFEEAMGKACEELGLDGHLKEIRLKKDCHSYAEKIVAIFKNRPYSVKNSYMYLDCMNFCFYSYKNDVNFALSGVVSRNDKLNIAEAINKALKLCELCEKYMRESD